MLSQLLTFLLSILASLIAWLLTVKAGDSFKRKSWPRIVLILGVFSAVFLVLTELQRKNEHSTTVPGPTPTSTATAVPQPAGANSRRAVPTGHAPVQTAAINNKSVENDVMDFEKGEFTTESYKFFVDSLRKYGASATASVTLLSLANKEIYFTIQRGSCYLVDENGERWIMDGHDPARFIEAGLFVIPDTKIKSKFAFTAKDSSTGVRFTLVCSEASPRYGRKIVVRGLEFE